MLKVFTIYSMALMIWDMLSLVCRMIKSNVTEERITSFMALVLYCPILYVLIEMLKML